MGWTEAGVWVFLGRPGPSAARRRTVPTPSAVVVGGSPVARVIVQVAVSARAADKSSQGDQGYVDLERGMHVVWVEECRRAQPGFQWSSGDECSRTGILNTKQFSGLSVDDSRAAQKPKIEHMFVV